MEFAEGSVSVSEVKHEFEKKLGLIITDSVLTFGEFPAQTDVSSSFAKLKELYDILSTKYKTHELEDQRNSKDQTDPNDFTTASLDFSFAHLKTKIDDFESKLTIGSESLAQIYTTIENNNKTFELNEHYDQFKSSESSLITAGDMIHVKNKLEQSNVSQKKWNDKI